MKKLTVEELTRRAFIWAEGDRESFSQCWPDGSSEKLEATDMARQLREYRMKRWGATAVETSISKADTMDARTKVIRHPPISRKP